jgi:hypothetical protein
MANFKIRRDTLMMQAACMSGSLHVGGAVDLDSTLNVDGAMVLAAGSMSGSLHVGGATDLDSTLNVDGDATFASSAVFSASTSFSSCAAFASSATVTGGLTASSSLTVGAGGANIMGILAGSFATSTPVITASAVGYASALITGLTPAHKIFVSPSAMSGSLFIYEAYCDGTCAAVIVNLLAAENVAEDTGAKFSYLAILDK